MSAEIEHSLAIFLARAMQPRWGQTTSRTKATLVCRQMGLDPDMTVADLRKRLGIAERVEKIEPDVRFPSQTFDPRYGRWCHTAEDLLRWIKRPNEDPTEANNMLGYPEGDNQ